MTCAAVSFVLVCVCVAYSVYYLLAICRICFAPFFLLLGDKTLRQSERASDGGVQVGEEDEDRSEGAARSAAMDVTMLGKRCLFLKSDLFLLFVTDTHA